LGKVEKPFRRGRTHQSLSPFGAEKRGRRQILKRKRITTGGT